MAQEKLKAGGIITFNPKETAPDFVLGTICITIEDLVDWARGEGKQYLTDYNGKKQIKLNVVSMKERRGIMVSVDTWKPEQSTAQKTPSRNQNPPAQDTNDAPDDLPF